MDELTKSEDIAIQLEILPGPSTKNAASDTDSYSDYSDDEYLLPTGDESQERIPKRAPRRATTKLNATLKGLMGEANLRYARGDIETAQKMCFEVMRQVPDAHEPYVTLSQIYENLDITKYEGYLAIASSLYSLDAGLWCQLAEINAAAGKYREASALYSRAIRANPRDMNIHRKRLEIVETLGDIRFALTCKITMARKLSRRKYQTILDLTTEVVTHYHQEKNYIKALAVVDIPFKRIPKRVTPHLINVLLELLLLTNQLSQCLDVFIQQCNFVFEITVDVDNKILINSYIIPPDTQIDIRVKFIQCLVKLKAHSLLSPLIDVIIRDEDVESIGDLYLDVAEDLMEAELPFEALKLLVPLVKSNTYNLAAVWLKYAECLYNCNMLEQAVEAYFTVMTMAPQHVEVLYPLAMTLLKLKKKSEALEVLSQDLSTNKLDVAVLIERMKLLQQISDYKEYWKCVELLLSRHCIVLKYPEEVSILMATAERTNEKLKRIKERRKFRGDSTPVESQYESIREPSVEVEYEAYKGVLKFAFTRGEYAQLQKFAFMGLTSKRFTQQYKEITLFAIFACIYNNDLFHGYSLLRNQVVADVDNNLAWNLFNMLLQKTDTVRHNRFISRFQERMPTMYCLQVIEANYALSSNNFQTAMKFYMKEFRKNRTPYLAFMLGVILLEGYSQGDAIEDKKKLAELLSCIFMHYAKHRSADAQQEVYYNLGRMYHQLGVMYLAEHYYLKLLELDEREDSEYFSLKREGAYNLHLIYKNSGNHACARDILFRHIVI